jgi:hypothetical protein
MKICYEESSLNIILISSKESMANVEIFYCHIFSYSLHSLNGIQLPSSNV